VLLLVYWWCNNDFSLNRLLCRCRLRLSWLDWLLLYGFLLHWLNLLGLLLLDMLLWLLVLHGLRLLHNRLSLCLNWLRLLLRGFCLHRLYWFCSSRRSGASWHLKVATKIGAALAFAQRYFLALAALSSDPLLHIVRKALCCWRVHFFVENTSHAPGLHD
jgi:hypothetical protein